MHNLMYNIIHKFYEFNSFLHNKSKCFKRRPTTDITWPHVALA